MVMETENNDLERNIFEWTFLQEMVLQYIQDEIDPEVKLGTYNHHVTNLHLYDFNGKQGYDVIEQSISQKLGLNADNGNEIEFPGVEEVHDFFKHLVATYSDLIEFENIPSIEDMGLIDAIFDEYKVLKEGNDLYTYAKLVFFYIIAKRRRQENMSVDDLKVSISGSDEMIHCIENSSFRHFEVDYATL